MAKRESLYKLTANVEDGTLTLAYGPEASPEKLVMAPYVGDTMVHVLNMATLHGLRQKIADKGALTAGESGKVDQQARLNAVIAEFVRLRDGGAWNVAGGERGPSMDVKVLIDAICMAKPDSDPAEVAAKVKTMDVKTRTALLGSEQLKLYVDEVRAQMTAGVDVEGSLEAFGL